VLFVKRRILIVALLCIPGCGGRPPIPKEFTVSGKPLAQWLSVLKAGTERERIKAVQALSNVGNADLQVVPAIAAALQDSAAKVRRSAALALLKIGPEARSAEEALAHTAESDADPDVRASATKALAVIREGK
jgi:HEAT repeat protein